MYAPYHLCPAQKMPVEGESEILTSVNSCLPNQSYRLSLHSGAIGLRSTFFLFIAFLCLPRDFLDCFYRFLTILSMIPITFIILKVLIHVCGEGEVSLLGFISLSYSNRILFKSYPPQIVPFSNCTLLPSPFASYPQLNTRQICR